MNKTSNGKMTIHRYGERCDYCGRISHATRRTVTTTNAGYDWEDSFDDTICLRCDISGTIYSVAVRPVRFLARRVRHIATVVPMVIKSRGINPDSIRLMAAAIKALDGIERGNGR